LEIINDMKNSKCKNDLWVQGLYEVKLHFHDKETTEKIFNCIEQMNNPDVGSSESLSNEWNMGEMITADKIDDEGNVVMKKVKKDD